MDWTFPRSRLPSAEVAPGVASSALPTVALAISTLDRHAILVRTLEALREIDLSPVRRVIRVDPSDPPLDIPPWQLDFPVPIEFVASQRRGLCIGRNEAIQRSREEIVLFLDDDVIPDRELAVRHARAYLDHPD